MPTEPKVRFNLKNVHYATYASTGFNTPVKVPGAVSLDLSAEGELNKFYADGIVYYQSYGNSGYSGSLELARIPDQMLQDIWGYTLGTTSKVLTEGADAEPVPFALLFQIDNDQNNDLFVLYNCMAGRPTIGSQTNEETRTPVTQSVDVSCGPMSTGEVLARTTANTPAATKTNWFSSVYIETTPTPPPGDQEDLEGT